MNFKVADDILFNERWSYMMQANENLLSVFHEALSDDGRIKVLAENVRITLNKLLELVPIKATVSVHMNRYDSFASIASDSYVRERATGLCEDGWVRVELFATKERIQNLANQFKVGVRWPINDDDAITLL